MLLTHLGHSCLLVDAAGVRILVDPGAFSQGFESLGGLDAVCVTHQHLDHLDADRLPAVLAGNPGALLYAETDTAARLRERGLEVTGLRPGDTVEVGGLRLDVVGGRHAVIHPEIPRIGNVGVVFSADGEPRLFHPGDSYETVPDPDAGPVDLLAWPLSAPWAALRDAVEFVRAVRPRQAVPVHDALLSPVGRSTYLRVAGGLLPEGTAVLDLAGQGETTITAGSG